METNQAETQVVAGEAMEPAAEERGIPQVGRKRNHNKPLFGFLAIVAVLLVLFLIARIAIGNFAGNRPKTTPVKDVASSITNLAKKDFDTAPPAPPPEAHSAAGGTPAAAAQPDRHAKLTPAQQQATDLAARRQRSPLLAVSGNGAVPSSISNAAFGDSAAANRYGSLGHALQATRESSVAATTLQNPNLTITEGTFIDCVLETALDSEEPGITRCVLPRNVYSTNGRVLLLPRGSRLVGEYQSGQLRPGQQRIFVIWTRVETPQGVVINLDSPSTDDLGRSGMAGRIDNHHMARFGAALLVSVVNDLSNFAVAKESHGGSTQLNFNTTTEQSNNLASIIAQNTINIPPTLYKNQGGHIGVFVTRDLYFGNVYGIRPVQRNAD